MSEIGYKFYDDRKVFDHYVARRKRKESPNDVIEKPIIDELVQNVEGLNILDLGCGDARYGLECLERGCAGYTGLDGSQNMFELARETLAGQSRAAVERADIERWDYPSQTYDLVVSRLVIHYIEDVIALFRQAHRTLKPRGRFVFSVEHPVLTSSYKGYQPDKKHEDWIVDDYFHAGPRRQNWLGGEVIKYHRTVEDYFVALQKAGFQVESLRESRPERNRFSEEESYLRRMRIPLFLFFAARKVD